MKVHLRMLGCRLNQSEIDTMARQLEQQGHTLVDTAAEADEIIVNTCAVTNEATRSSRRMIRDLNRENETATINVTGCYAQIKPQDIEVLPGVRRVVSNAEKSGLVTQITGQPVEPFDREPHERLDHPGAAARTRAFVKVQDGCENACTFCVTTVARGHGRSEDADSIINEIQHLVTLGYQEAVLTGVHLGSYGHDLAQPDGLRDLVLRILDETDLPRLRLSSLEPWDLADDFFDLWQNPRLLPHLHLPLQSGCDRTLRRMRRNTDQANFAGLVEAARSRIRDLRLTTDVIVGFPGETEAEFAESRDFIRAMDFAGMHVFRYSVRPGTPAARMRGQVPNRVKKARSHELLSMAAEGEQRFAERYTGQTLPILWEQISGSSDDGFHNVGYSDNYIRVAAVHPRVLTNVITPATVHSVADGVAQVTPVLE